jgi:hypothetical protein
VPYASGTSLVAFPDEGIVLTATLKDENLFELSGVTYVRLDTSTAAPTLSG